MRNVLLILSFFLSGCNVYQHISELQPVSLFSKKHDMAVTIGTTFPAGSDGPASANISYALTDHFGVFCSTRSYRRKVDARAPLIMSHDGEGYTNSATCFMKNINGAFCYYNRFDKYLYAINCGFEYGSYGYAHSQICFDPTKMLSGDLAFYWNSYDYFIQPEIGLKKSKYLEFVISSRFNFMNCVLDHQSGLQTLESAGKIGVGDNFFQGRNSKNIFLIEPALTVRGGWTFVKGQGQLILPITANQIFFPANQNIYMPLFVVYFSLFFNINTLDMINKIFQNSE